MTPQPLKESDIRPEDVFAKYLSLAKKDAATYFSPEDRIHVSCPACAYDYGIRAFQKDGFVYEECPVCGTLYANPIPDQESYMRYYRDSPSMLYLATMYSATEDSRRKLLIRPKAERVNKIIDTHTIPKAGDCVVDIGSGSGIFCEELRSTANAQYDVVGIEPSSAFIKSYTEKQQISTIGKFFEEVTIQDFDGKRIIAATAFELMEHLHDPARFIRHCHTILPHGALLILTTLNWHGFDLQLLREKSRSIQPPAHINFFTTDSIQTLLKRNGFDILKVTTPGKLDVDIVVKQADDIHCEFISHLIKDGDEEMLLRLQEFLQGVNASSHMEIIARNVKQEKSTGMTFPFSASLRREVPE